MFVFGPSPPKKNVLATVTARHPTVELNDDYGVCTPDRVHGYTVGAAYVPESFYTAV